MQPEHTNIVAEHSQASLYLAGGKFKVLRFRL